MIGFKKLILTTAILAASSSALAMQAMDEATLSATTGQDGLTVTLDTNLSGIGITYIDRDGVTGDPTYASSGAVVISPVGVSTTGLTIDIDAGGSTAAAGNTGGSGMLQIAITAPNATTIDLNATKISVADADTTGATVGTKTDIITFAAGAQLVIDGSATPMMTIQLGNETQGAMINMVADIANASLTGLTINDANSSGSVKIDTLTLGSVHAVNAIDLTTNGLSIDTTGTTIGTVGLERVRLGATATIGTAAAIGDLYLTNITSSGTITIAGH